MIETGVCAGAQARFLWIRKVTRLRIGLSDSVQLGSPRWIPGGNGSVVPRADVGRGFASSVSRLRRLLGPGCRGFEGIAASVFRLDGRLRKRQMLRPGGQLVLMIRWTADDSDCDKCVMLAIGGYTLDRLDALGQSRTCAGAIGRSIVPRGLDSRMAWAELHGYRLEQPRLWALGPAFRRGRNGHRATASLELGGGRVTALADCCFLLLRWY
jgi:hypothetical protein